MRHLYLLLLCFPLVLTAGPGPGSGGPLPYLEPDSTLQRLIGRALEYQPADALLERGASAAERSAIAAAFAAPTAISDRGDDLRKVAALSDSARAEIAKMRGVLDQIRNPARQVKNLTEAALQSLPLGIHQRVGNIDIHLAIAEARLTATQAEVDIYLGLDLPNTTQDPIFIARGVGWSRKGGFTGNIDLELVADWGIDFNSGGSRLIIRRTEGGREGTYVTVDCDGFVAGRLEATVLLSRDWVIPVFDRIVHEPNLNDSGLSGYRIEDRVHADFTIDLAAGEGFLAEVNLEQAFVFANKPDVQITIGAIAIDLSDAANPSELIFPENYHSPHVTDGFAATTWQGFYLRGLKVRLPDEYSKQSGDTLTIGAPYLIVDRSGFTGHFYADNVLPLGDKTADGWAFSVDTFDLQITQNTFESARLMGLINVPLLAGAADACYVTLNPDAPVGDIRREDCLGYAAHINQGGFDFSVRTASNYCVNLWKADLVIEPNSGVDLSFYNGRFDASATIHGTLLIDAEVSPQIRFTMDSLSFDDLTLSNREPHFSPGLWDFPRSVTAQLKDFSLSFTHINLSVDSLDGGGTRKAALNFATRLNVDGDMRLDCRGVFKLTGYLKETDEKQQWRFQKLRMKAFFIDASTDSWGIKAAIAFYEYDPRWGSGFYGAGKLRISALGGSEIAAVAQFGTFENPAGLEEKYFFVDVMAKFGNGITLPGGVKLMGIGGGVYKNMTRATPIGQSFANPNDTQITLAENKVNQVTATQSPLDGILGESTSGIRYEVDLGNRFGAFLQVIISGENEEAFSVNARLELEVRDDGGWRAALDGNVTVMGPVNFDNDPRKTEGVGIFIHMSYVKSATYSGFKATADVFINIQDNTIAGGLADSTGVTPQPPPSDTARQERLVWVDQGMGYAGNISLEFSSERWYIHVGYPAFPGSPQDKRIAMAVKILGASVGAASYFCVGQDVPPIPPLPPRVAAIAGQMDMSRDFAQYESAAGFAFGTELSLAAGGQFLIFYYGFEAGIGFDINVRNYGDAICAGGDTNGPGIGIDGWYAAGQAYAYIDAEVGIQTPWWLGNIRVNIFNAGVAAVLQVKAPNPTWARGVVAGYYSVCGGVLKGRFRVEGEFGDNCVLAGRDGGDPFAGIDVITAIAPDSSAVDVAVGTEINVYTALPINAVTAVGDREYRADIISQELRLKATGAAVTGFPFADNGAFSFRYVPEDFLAAGTEYEYTVEIRVRGRDVGEFSWESDDVKRETRVYPFTTGAAPEVLSPANVAYSYPMDGQANFYRREYAGGFVKLHRKQPSLTDEVTAVYETSGGLKHTAPVSWDDLDDTYEWNHPTSLRTSTVYRLSLVRNYEPPVAGGGGGNNNGGGNTNPGGTDQQLPGGGQGGLPDGGPAPFWRFDPPAPFPDEDAVSNQKIYAIYFRTSRYSTFAAKLNAAFPQTQLTGGTDDLHIAFDNVESFDSLELFGTLQGGDPLVVTEITEGENLTPSLIQPRFYDHLPFDCPTTIPEHQRWEGLDATVPYDAVSLTARMPRVTESDYTDSPSVGDERGGRLSLGFPGIVTEQILQISAHADTTLRDLINRLVIGALNAEPGVQIENLAYGNFAACFPGLEGQLAGFNPPSHVENPSTSFIERTLLRELAANVPNACELPRALTDIYSLRSNLQVLNPEGTSYPVRFNYVLPDGRRQPDVILTFDF